MRTLIIAEHDQHHLAPSTHQLITAAKQFNQPITLLIIGHQCGEKIEQAAMLPSIAETWCVDDPCYVHYLAENWGDCIVKLITEEDTNPFSHVLIAASTFGKDLLPRVAALLDVTQVSDVIKIIDENTFEHPIYAGNAIETVRVLDQLKLLTIRTVAFDEATVSENDTAHKTPLFNKTHPIKPQHTQFISQQFSQSSRPELANASVIVAGGRGLQSAEQFKLIESLADSLNAAVGASRAAVDAGFVSNDCQVGQTGKIVAPQLYFAIGISGAVQHLAGMKDSKVIVAINKDPEAPIFQVATYGLVGDLFEIVPELIQKLKE